MIASRLGVAIAFGIAAVLALVLVLARQPARELTDRALVPGFVPAQVTELAWRSHRIRILRDPKSPTGWAWVDPAGAAEASVVADVLGAAGGARWHRRGSAATAGTIVETVTLGPLAIQIGAPLGDEQQWLVIGSHAYLVDTWVARALVPDPVTLRVRRPLAAAAKSIRIEPVAGQPLVIAAGRLVEPVALVPARALLARLEAALEQLEVAALPTTPAGPRGTKIEADGVEVVEHGACASGRIQIVGTFGGGCVEASAWAELIAASGALRGAPETIVERRPIAFDPARIRLVDGAVLDVARRPQVGPRDADPDRARELVAALGAPARTTATVTGKPIATLAVTDRAGVEQVLELHPGSVVVRRGEPIGLALEPVAYAVLTRPGSIYRDPTLWHEEPTTVRTVAIDGITFARGVALGEWTRSGGGAVDPARLEQLVAALAAPRAIADAPTRPARRTLVLELAPPVGAARQRTLGIVGMVSAGCHVIADGESVVLAREVCELAAGLR